MKFTPKVIDIHVDLAAEYARAQTRPKHKECLEKLEALYKTSPYAYIFDHKQTSQPTVTTWAEMFLLTFEPISKMMESNMFPPKIVAHAMMNAVWGTTLAVYKNNPRLANTFITILRDPKEFRALPIDAIGKVKLLLLNVKLTPAFSSLAGILMAHAELMDGFEATPPKDLVTDIDNLRRGMLKLFLPDETPA